MALERTESLSEGRKGQRVGYPTPDTLEALRGSGNASYGQKPVIAGRKPLTTPEHGGEGLPLDFYP